MNASNHEKDLLKPLLWGLSGFALIFTLLLMANPMSDPPQHAVVTVKTLIVGSSPSLSTRRFSGRIQSGEQIDLAFNVSGQLLEYAVKEGQNVSKGQVLARLNPKEFHNTLEQEKSKYHQVLARYNRAKGLIKTKIISQNDFNTIESDFETLKHRVDTTSKTLDDMVLVAPFSGQINKQFAKDYQYVQAKQPIVSLQNPKHLEILIDIPERMLPKTPDAKKNIHFSALIDELPNEKIPLIIKSYGAKNDSVNTYPVLLSLPNLQQLKVDLLPGMLITVVAEYKTAESILENQFQIPLSAIWVSENQTKYVWVVDPLKMSVYKREVQIHPAHHQNTQIVKGLKKGEIIVTAGTHNLREGAKVKFYQQQPPH